MKLYSILIFYKNPSDGKAKLLKSAYDLSSFSFFQRNSVKVGLESTLNLKFLKEFMEFAGKLSVERSATSSRSTIKEQDYYCHCYVRADNLAGLCVTDNEYQARVAFSMLTKVMDDFEQAVPASKWPLIPNEKDCTYNKLNELLVKWQNPREADALTRVQVSFSCYFSSIILGRG